mgnify:CR=1 FL=1
MKEYNKLVRDKIPEIIKANGEIPVVYFADEKRYILKFKEKLQEEVSEFIESEDIEELADVLEVVHALISFKGKTFDEIEKIRINKLEKRGGFKNKIILEKVN